MKSILTAVAVLILAIASFAQTAPTSVFEGSTVSFGLTPITLPRLGSTLTGAETDILVGITTNNIVGPTTIISSSPFVGGRYDRIFPSVGKWLQNHTALTGANFQAYATGSIGIVKASKEYWGERAGIGLRYAPAGAQNFSVAFEAQWNNFPGIAHNIPSLAVSPTFRF